MNMMEKSRLAKISPYDKYETNRILSDFCITIKPDYSQFANIGELEDWRRKVIHDSLNERS